MKLKNILLFIILIITHGLSYATTQGHNKSEYFSNNVGIGTTNPVAKLEVIGTTKFGGVINTNGNWISGDGGAEGLMVNTAGNVGINNTAPKCNLHIGSAETSMTFSWGEGLIISDDNVPRIYIEDTGETTDDKLMAISYYDQVMRIQSLVDTALSYNVENILAIHRDGNVGIGTASPVYKLDVRGGTVAGAGAYVNTSHSKYKEQFKDVNVLSKVMQIPIREWQFKKSYIQDDNYRHISPFAEDFYKQFKLGESDEKITSLDIAGVALKAVQELKAQKDTEIAELKSENETMSKRLEILESKLKWHKPDNH